MSAEQRTLGYIAATARNVSDRLMRDVETGLEVDADHLAEDVAWLARQVAKLADLAAGHDVP